MCQPLSGRLGTSRDDLSGDLSAFPPTLQKSVAPEGPLRVLGHADRGQADQELERVPRMTEVLLEEWREGERDPAEQHPAGGAYPPGHRQQQQREAEQEREVVLPDRSLGTSVEGAAQSGD